MDDTVMSTPVQEMRKGVASAATQLSPASAALNVLGTAGTGRTALQPFPHVMLPEALAPSVYAELEQAFPTLETILAGRRPDAENAAVRLSAVDVLANDNIDRLWRDFFAFHGSADFWAAIVRVFGNEMRRAYPDLEGRVGRKLEDFRVGLRGTDQPADVKLECQFVMNTPSSTTSSVKTPHVDKRQTIFSGLFYLRNTSDISEGGELELYRWKRAPRFLTYRMILPGDAERVASLPYARNSMIGFLNSAQAVHGVSPRGPSIVPRRYINLIAELPFHLFAAPYMGVPARLWHWREAGQIRRRQVAGGEY
ncbi:MAG TPA: hypothetical protein VM659_14560 [Dongiaceae bacterium]|nr:hypothetical protein [Dongiaceae bacterium]